MELDIEDLITKLQSSGMTQKEIADEIECAQSTISDIANGKLGKTRPSYKIVDGLNALAKKRGVLVKASKSRSRRKSDVAPYARKYPDPKISS